MQRGVSKTTSFNGHYKTAEKGGEREDDRGTDGQIGLKIIRVIDVAFTMMIKCDRVQTVKYREFS